MDSKVICCFCGKELPELKAVQLAIFPTAGRDESQVLYCHRQCLSANLADTIPKHPALDVKGVVEKPNAYKYYLFDLGYELKGDALAARRERDCAPAGSEDRQFKAGRLFAYYEVISRMQQRAEGFGIPLSDLRLDDINPDRELL